MKTIIITAINKGETGGSMNQTIRIDGLTKEQIQSARDEFFKQATATYPRWYYQVESQDDFTKAEEEILTELELEIDF